MKLQELRGYKGSKLYQQGTRIEPSHELFSRKAYEPKSIQGFISELHKSGWETLGEGHFAIALQHPSLSYIIKIFNSSPGYLKFIKAVRDNQSNPFFPKIRGKFMRLNDTTQVVRMEKLTTLSGDDDPILFAYVDPNIEEDGTILETIFSYDNIAFLRKNYPDLYRAIELIESIAGPTLDLHSGNIMKRGNVPVLTDLIAG